jgi:hypothetical protein
LGIVVEDAEVLRQVARDRRPLGQDWLQGRHLIAESQHPVERAVNQRQSFLAGSDGQTAQLGLHLRQARLK